MKRLTKALVSLTASAGALLHAAPVFAHEGEPIPAPTTTVAEIVEQSGGSGGAPVGLLIAGAALATAAAVLVAFVKKR